MSVRGRGRKKTDTEPKTGKKKFPVVAVVTPDGIEGSLLQKEHRPLIVHLPIHSRDVIDHDMPIVYDPQPPVDTVPYDNFNPFQDEVEQIVTEVIPSVVVEKKEVKSEEIDYYNLKGTILVQFKNSSDVKQIPSTSSAACLWCCHTFGHRPVILPIRDTGEYIEVMGNFCSPECATAYLFDIRQDSHTRWEQLSLLYRIYGACCNGNIHPAPVRTVLKLFGGALSIEEYRQLLQSQKVLIDIHLPPMVSILATMDTKPIDFYDSGLTKNVMDTVHERLQKAEEGLRLRRTKPLKAWESTLDACINFRIKA
jgi:hypothetical protein